MPSKKKEEKTLKKERILPFYNLSLDKQIDVVKAYVAYYDRNKKAAHYKDIASVAGVHHTQASGCRKFWRSIELLEEKDGSDIPANFALEFVRNLEWKKEDQAWKLFGNHIINTWFVNQVTMALRLQKKMSEDELMNSLGSAAGLHRKDPHAVASLRILLELLTRSRVIIEDEETKKSMLHPEFVKEAEPLELPEKGENLIPVIIGDEHYVVSPQELKEFIKKHGKKVASKEYVMKS